MSKRKCPCCGLTKVGPIRRWRTNTMYADDSLNYQTSCYACILGNDHMRYWDWREYYSAQGWYDHSEYMKRSPKEYIRFDKPDRYGVFSDHGQFGRIYRHLECAQNYCRMMISITGEQHWVGYVYR